MVYVTHDQVEAMTLADRIVVLRAGRIEQVGTPAELYDQPGQHLRRRLHRLAADELPRRHAWTASKPGRVRLAHPALAGDTVLLPLRNGGGRASRATRSPWACGPST